MFTLPNLFSRNKPTSPPPASRQAVVETPPSAPPTMSAPGLLDEVMQAIDIAPLVESPDPDSASAIAKWQELAGVMPNSPRPHLRLGMALCERGDYGDAILSLQRVIRMGREGGPSSTDNALAYCALGYALIAQGQHSENALQAFRQAMILLNTTPDFAPPSLVEGIRHYEQGYFEAAIPALEKTVGLSMEDGLFGTDAALAHCVLGCARASRSSARDERVLAEFRAAYQILRQFTY